MSGVVVFAAAESVQRVDMQVDDLMKICFSIGVLSSKVIPNQYLVPPSEVKSTKKQLDNSPPTKTHVNVKLAPVAAKAPKQE